MRCCKLLPNSVDKMSRSIFILILSLSLPITVSLAAKLDLGRLLQPLQPIDLQQETEQEREPVESPEAQAGPQHVRITKQAAVEALLRAGNLSIPEEDTLEVVIKSGWEPVSVPVEADWELYVADRFAPDNRGRWSPMLILEVNGDVAKRWRVRCDVDLYRRVYMTTQRLGRGETPMRPGIRAVICNIYEEPIPPIPVTEDLQSYEMVRTISVGQFLTWEDVSPRRAVRKGEHVDVVLEKGELSISMRAMCMQDGVVNQTVRLKNPRTRSEFAGLVTAPGLITIVD
jgi:flagella basal body P-ring formation protein FlgA